MQHASFSLSQQQKDTVPKRVYTEKMHADGNSPRARGNYNGALVGYARNYYKMQIACPRHFQKLGRALSPKLGRANF